MDAVILHHASCLDGFTSAYYLHNYFVSLKKYTNIDVVPMQYGQPIVADIAGKDVVVVDFSFKRGNMINLAKEANSFVVLDHHQTAEVELHGVDFCFFDPGRCGVQLACDYIAAHRHAPSLPVAELLSRMSCRRKEEYPLLVQYVADRDLWTKELPFTDEVNAYLMTLDRTFPDWASAEATLEHNFKGVRMEGQAILRYIKKTAYTLADKAYRCHLRTGHWASIVNSATLQSEIGHILTKGGDIGVVWFQLSNGDYVFSLRSEGDVDVSEIAKSYGGGGHKNAAGFTVPQFPFPRG